MKPIDIGRKARTSALAGPADLGILRVSGKDAATFLHAQTTNDVVGLAAGTGHLGARTTRTGHLSQVFSLHRYGDDFWLVLERAAVPALREDLDRFLFSEQAVLEDVSAAWRFLLLQGPQAPRIALEVFGRVEVRPWEEWPEQAIFAIPKGWGPLVVPKSLLAIRRSLTGDPGYLFAWRAEEPADALIAALRDDVLIKQGAWAEGEALAEALDALRIEAGWPRVGPDTPGKPPLLPETGLEQHAVSYTKGCYLGQEVIARVRTYGSVPVALRGLRFPEGTTLESLPASGSELVLTDGAKVGTITSRAASPLLEGEPIALAFLTRGYRTPGQVLPLSGDLAATVVLLPFHRSSDQAQRVAQLYDRGVRVFAEGKVKAALALLEDALRVDPAHADSYEAIGVILGKSGSWHEAIDFFRRLEEVAPTEPLVNTNLSVYYMKLGDKGTAEAEAAKAMEKSLVRGTQGTREAGEVATEVAKKRRDDAARKRGMFRKVLDFDPVDPIALFGLGSALSTLGEWDEAVAILEKATTVSPNQSAAWLLRGKALEALSRGGDAIEVYRRGMEVASRRGDLQPLQEMEHRTLLLGGARAAKPS